MLKHVYRLLGLVIVFAAALIFFGKNIEVIQVRVDNSITQMDGETLPIVSLKSYGVEANRLYGYVSNTPANSVRESITVLNNEKQIDVNIDEHATKINKLNFEVRAVTDNELLDSGEVTAFADEDGRRSAKIKLETELKASTEYALKITLITDVSKKVNYYTRLKYYSNECYIKEKLDFVMNFHKMTFKKDEKLATYIEPDAENDNSSLAHVDITSSFDNIVWGELTPARLTEITPTVKEINIETGAFVLDYFVSMNTDTGIETYYVSEYYRVKRSDERMYLLWFERNVEAQFDASLASINKSELKLGIMNDGDTQLISNDTANKTAFSRNGNVYMYDLTENKIYNVYSQYINSDEFDHELYRQQSVHIISIDEEGNVCFAVYGYIAHGAYEGKVAIVLYRFHKTDNAIEELLYIPFQTTYQILKENFEEYSYLNASDVFYFAIDDRIYSYNLVSEKLTCMADNIGERNFTIIPESSSYVWESAQTNGLATEITIMNLETGQTTVIPSGDKNYIRLVGVMGTNVVYGIGKTADISSTTEGARIYAMKKVEIMNKESEVIKSYSKKKVYITGAYVEGNVVFLKRAKKERKTYKSITDDNILNRMNDVRRSVEIYERVTDRMMTEKYISFPGTFVMEEIPQTETSGMYVVKEEKALYLGDYESALKYYVYAKGGIKGAYSNPAEAIVNADNEQGVVISSKNQTVWERGGRFLSGSVSGVENIRTGSGVTSIDACVYMLLNSEHLGVNMKDIKNSDKSMLDMIGEYMNEPVNLTGCNLDEVLYFVSAGKPVIAMKDNNDAVLITAYNSSTVTIYDPSTGQNQTMFHANADSLFAGAGNIYVSYMKGE